MEQSDETKAQIVWKKKPTPAQQNAVPDEIIQELIKPFQSDVSERRENLSEAMKRASEVAKRLNEERTQKSKLIVEEMAAITEDEKAPKISDVILTSPDVKPEVKLEVKPAVKPAASKTVLIEKAVVKKLLSTGSPMKTEPIPALLRAA